MCHLEEPFCLLPGGLGGEGSRRPCKPELVFVTRALFAAEALVVYAMAELRV